MPFNQEQIHELKQKLIHGLLFVPRFLRSPVSQIKDCPSPDWAEILLLQFSISLLSGAITGILHASILWLLWFIFIFPILSLILSFVYSLAIYYILLYWLNYKAKFRSIFTLVVIASIPFMLFRMATPFVKIIDPIAAGFSTFLLCVGLIENFKLPKEKCIKMMASLYAVFIFSWLVNSIF